MRIGGLIKTVLDNLGISYPCCHGVVRVREGETMSRAYKSLLIMMKLWQLTVKTMGELWLHWQCNQIKGVDLFPKVEVGFMCYLSEVKSPLNVLWSVRRSGCLEFGHFSQQGLCKVKKMKYEKIVVVLYSLYFRWLLIWMWNLIFHLIDRH